MKTCPHRGFPLEPGKPCGYHGLCFPKDAAKFVPGPFDDFRDSDGFVRPDIHELIEERLGDQFYLSILEVKAPFHLWMQNTADRNHLRSVHPEFASLFCDDPPPQGFAFSRDRKISTHLITVRPEIVKKYERALDKPLFPWFQHWLFFPNISITSFLSVFYSIEVVREMGPNRCIVETRFYTDTKFKFPEAFLEAARRANAEILAQDKRIVEAWAPTAKVTGNWLPDEERIRVYLDLLKEQELYDVYFRS